MVSFKKDQVKAADTSKATVKEKRVEKSISSAGAGGNGSGGRSLEKKLSDSLGSLEDVEGAGRMKVLVRIRPLSKQELQSKANLTPTVQANNDEKTLQIFNADGKITVMSFNRVYDENSDQQMFFENSGVTDLINQSFNGFVTTVFAFGQTGSGKTFTITGPDEDIAPSPESMGIVPRGLEYLFDYVEKQRASKAFTSIRIQASYMEIYNENVLDLLNPQNSGLPVRWSIERGFFVEHLYIVDCDSLDDCLAVLEEGLRNRTTAAHDINEHSSRSHSVLTIYMEIQGFDENKEPQHRYGKISFVDLAGSEKVKESRTTLDTFAEALSINKSLLTLGKCISALADPKTRGGHIPFRDSKLTKLLADSLSGRGQALMIACISPAFQNLNETLKTVRYAMQARKIQNRPVIQLDPQEEMVMNFKLEIQQLKKENSKLKHLIENDPKYRDTLQKINEESEEFQRKLSKSRPASPLSSKPRGISYRDRLESSIPSLPDIRNNSSKQQQQQYDRASMKTPLPAHSRRSTVGTWTSTNVKKPLINALPNRLIEGKRNLQPKSAAKQRIESMARSLAPAGQENETRRASIAGYGGRDGDTQRDSISRRESLTKKAINYKAPQNSHSRIPSSSASKKQKLKRPSNHESMPEILKEPFPDSPIHSRSTSTKKKILVNEAVAKRHETLKEVEQIDEEINRMKRSNTVKQRKQHV